MCIYIYIHTHTHAREACFFVCGGFYKNVYSNIISDSKKLETAQMSTNNRLIVGHLYNENTTRAEKTTLAAHSNINES